jgi:hypothetical protein
MRKSISIAGLVLSVAGFVIFIALGVSAWFAKREADRRVNAAAVQAQQAGEVASHVVRLVREVIARAQVSLTTSRAGFEPAGDINDPMVRLAMWKATRELPDQVEKARDAVHIASEALIVAESVLDVFVEHKPDETVLGVRAGDMGAARSQLESAASDLKNARTVLGIPIAPATPEQYSQVDQALASATDLTNRVDDALKLARHKVDEAKASAHRWSLRAAIIISALTALAALGQVFLFRASWRGLRSTGPA